MSQWWELATIEVNLIEGKIRRSVARRIEKRFHLLLSTCETTPGAVKPLLGSPHETRYWQTGTNTIKLDEVQEDHNGAAADGTEGIDEGAGLSQPDRVDHGMHYNCRYLLSCLKGDMGMNKADVSQRCSKHWGRLSEIVDLHLQRFSNLTQGIPEQPDPTFKVALLQAWHWTRQSQEDPHLTFPWLCDTPCIECQC